MAKKPFKTLFGNRVIISADFLKQAKEETEGKGKIELIGETKKQVEQEKIAENDKFIILQVGTECNDLLTEGSTVYIENALRILNPETSETLIENGEIIGFIVPERQIAGIY